MKRLICLLLLLTLLTGCAAHRPVQESEAPKPTEETTAGGFHVATNYSGYTQREPLKPLYTRLSEEWIDELRPAEDYGAIYPFAGTSPQWSYSAGSLFGLVDAQGRIICDPVYTEIRQPLLQRQYDSVAMPMWVLGRIAQTSEDYTMQCQIATLDGSFVSRSYSNVSACQDGILGVRIENDGTVLDVYDYEGHLLFSTENLSLSGEPDTYAFMHGFSEGLILLAVGADEDMPGRYHETRYYYYNLDGEVVLGPYTGASAFFEGYATVAGDDGRYYYIDKTGKRLNDGDYFSASPFYCGFAVAQESEWSGYVLLDSDGEVVLRAEEGESIYADFYGLNVVNGESTTFYDRDLKPIGVAMSYEYSRLGATQQLLQWTESGWDILDMRSGELLYSLTFPQYSYCEIPNNYCTDVRFLCVCMQSETDFNSQTIYLYDENFAERYKGNASFTVLRGAEGEVYFAIAEAGRFLLLNEDFDTVLTLRLEGDNSRVLPALYGDRLCFDGQIAAEQYDMDGNLLFRYIYPSSMED